MYACITDYASSNIQLSSCSVFCICITYYISYNIHSILYSKYQTLCIIHYIQYIIYQMFYTLYSRYISYQIIWYVVYSIWYIYIYVICWLSYKLNILIVYHVLDIVHLISYKLYIIPFIFYSTNIISRFTHGKSNSLHYIMYTRIKHISYVTHIYIYIRYYMSYIKYYRTNFIHFSKTCMQYLSFDVNVIYQIFDMVYDINIRYVICGIFRNDNCIV